MIKEQRVTKPFRPWWKVAAEYNQASKSLETHNGETTVINRRQSTKYRAVVSAC